MKKIRSIIAMLLIAMMFLMPIQASATESVASVRLYNANYCAQNALQQCGQEIVELANARIETIISESVYLASLTDNPDVINGIIVSMMVRTTAVSQAAQLAAGLCGVMTVCEYVAVEIGGQTVMVDPLRVVLV